MPSHKTSRALSVGGDWSVGQTPSVILLTIAVVVGVVATVEPAGTWGTYSQLEVALAVLALALVGSQARGGARSRLLAIPIPLAALLVLMVLSTLWSEASWSTLRDATSYVVFAAAAWVIVRNTPVRVIVRAVALAGCLLLGASVLMLVLSPERAFYYEASGFQGIYANRNALGMVMAQVLPAVLALPTSSIATKVLKSAAVASVAIAAAFTLSKTTLVAVCLVLLLWATLLLARRSRWYPAVIGGAVVVVAVVALVNWSRVLAALGKGDSINGRLDIWAGVLRVLPESPWLGFGWSRSWPVGTSHSVAVADSLGGTVVYHAHNEVLNWLVTTGILGAALIVMLYAMSIRFGLRAYWQSSKPELIWIPLSAVGLVVRGLTDISETNAQGWFIFMLVLFATVYHLPESDVRERRWAFFSRTYDVSKSKAL